MSKVKSGEIPHYELLYLIANKYSEEEIKPIIEKVNALITNNQGKITQSLSLGKKRLAYPIKGFRFGYYILAEFDMPGANLIIIGNTLRLMSEILRSQIVVKEVKTAEQIEQDKKIAAKIAARNIKEEKLAEEKVQARQIAPVSAPKAADKDKVDLKDLDEKLDKILETDNLL
jgi:small subunit ribosomal protein S6